MTDGTELHPATLETAEPTFSDAFLAALDWDGREQRQQEQLEEGREILLGSVNP